MTFQYTILAGDSLSRIANEINACQGVTIEQIENANPNLNPAELIIGQVVSIPATVSGQQGLHYTIRPGDDLGDIVAAINAAAGITYQEIEQANPNVQANRIMVGAVLTIPTHQSTSTGTEGQKQENNNNSNSVSAANIGYWHWTWHTSIEPADTTMGMAFYGAVDPAEALAQSKKIKDRLQGEKYICLGGGTSSGKYSSAAITKIITAINAGDFAGYQGIAFDIEVGASGLVTNFQQAFTAAKTMGFKVLVTVSHSRPYGIGDGNSLMDAFFVDKHIDFLSPQLYTTGKETSNDYTAYGIKWSQYATAQAAVIPSIVKAEYYSDAVSYFKNQGVDLAGYVQWQQN